MDQTPRGVNHLKTENCMDAEWNYGGKQNLLVIGSNATRLLIEGKAVVPVGFKGVSIFGEPHNAKGL